MDVKVAVTEALADSVTEQEPVPEQAPLHPENVEPESGVAVSAALVPCANGALHVAPQLIPAGTLKTVPVPVPVLLTESVKFVVGGPGVNVAVTEVLADSVTEQEPVPEQDPPHPENVEPESGMAVSATLVPCANGALHVAPQLIPAGALETVPVPVPVLLTESVKFVAELEPSKRAVTALPEFIDKPHWP